ncbi:MAG: Semialdehyde dehydrogenase - binding protein [Bacteroidetes bacterium]|nr:Semialdehyde dehydrogenase - binding protein [Bacteroidota bacterium]
MKKALVIGATGLVGTELVHQLLENNSYSEVVSFVRHASGTNHPKLSEHIVDFDKPNEWKELLKGDVLYSALGTTIAKAKTKDNQHKVDFTYQYQTAKTASENGVKSYILVSAAGALPFDKLQIFRPGQLDGNRIEKRTGEKIALKAIYFINKLGLLKRYRPIQAEELAKAMIISAEKNSSGIYTLDEIFRLI